MKPNRQLAVFAIAAVTVGCAAAGSSDAIDGCVSLACIDGNCDENCQPALDSLLYVPGTNYRMGHLLVVHDEDTVTLRQEDTGELIAVCSVGSRPAVCAWGAPLPNWRRTPPTRR